MQRVRWRHLAWTRCNVHASRFNSTSTRAPEYHDIVIIGGGNVGLALAAAILSKTALPQAYKVTLIESSDLSKVSAWNPAQNAFENRCSSITRQSRSFLKSIGAWEHIRQDRICPVLDMQVWDGVSNAHLNLSDMELRDDILELDPGMAFMTENTNLQQALLCRLQELAFQNDFELIAPVKLAEINREKEENGGWPILHLENGRQLRARLLVGADGPNSPVRRYAGIDTYGWSYDEHGVVATLALQSFSANSTAWQRFLPSGPIAMLPFPNDRASLVWSTKPAVAAALRKTSPKVVASLINAAFRLPYESIEFLYSRLVDSDVPEVNLLEEIEWRSSYDVLGPAATQNSMSNQTPPEVIAVLPQTIASFPYRFSHAASYIGEPPLGDHLPSRTVLVGDAAHSMHPLAGQGLNTGLKDAESLAKSLENALELGQDAGTVLALKEYSRDRYLANHLLMSGIDKLHKLYGTEFSPLVWARSTGLEIVNESSILRKFFMNRAGASERDQRHMSLLASALASTISAASAVSHTASALTGAIKPLAQSQLRKALGIKM